MNETKEPHEQYRHQLASQLHNTTGGAKILEREKPTHIYKVAEALHREKLPTSRASRSMFDETELLEGETRYYGVSNEPSLYQTFPYIKDVSGVGLGVGFDQMFDITINSQLKEIYIVDFEKSSVLRTRALLEVGRRHKELFGTYPTPQEFIKYFGEADLPITLEMVQGAFTPEEQYILSTAMSRRMSLDPMNKPETTDHRAPLEILHYLEYKSGQKDFHSWISTAESLAKIIQMYEDGKLHVTLANLGSQTAMSRIAESLEAKQQHISLIYLSNARGYSDNSDIENTIKSMPITDDTILIETTFPIGREGTPRPWRVLLDPYLRKNTLSWIYMVQTMAHRRKINGDLYYNTGPEAEVRKPKKGLLIAGLPVRGQGK